MHQQPYRERPITDTDDALGRSMSRLPHNEQHTIISMSRPGPSNESAEYPRIHPGGSLILAWQLKGKKVLIVGGGQVAAGECNFELLASVCRET